MSLRKLNSAADAWAAAEQKLNARAPVEADDGWQLFRARYPAHNTLTGQEIEERCGGDDQLRADLHQFCEETNALKERMTQEVESAVRNAQQEIGRLQAIVAK